MRIAALQMQAEAGDPAANLALIDKAAREARAGGAALLIAPELALPGYGAGEAIRALAEPADGRQVAALRASAATNGIAILAGFAERDGDTVYNSAVFVDGARTRRLPQGVPLRRLRKAAVRGRRCRRPASSSMAG